MPRRSPPPSPAFRRRSTGSGSDLYLIDVASGSVQPLALAGEQRLPVWSPDGTRLIFVHQATASDRPDLYSMGTDGATPTPLVTTAVGGGSLNPAFLRRASLH
jgi:Tol biopolymer transport system component